MQNNSAKKDATRDDAAQRAADGEINERLVEHLKANAIRADRSTPANDRLPQRGFFAETYALVSIVGLMVVAYVYTLLVGNEA